jgi:hypothetical protein
MPAESQVNGLLSKCLLVPDFLELLDSSPREALKGLPTDGGVYDDFIALDKERLRRFSGFIAKVQHNHLWEWFPLTRRMLRFLGFESQVFTSYAATHQELRRQPGLKQAAKAETFLDFLQDFLTRQGSTGARLLDLTVHERALWMMSRRLTVMGEAATPPSAPHPGTGRLLGTHIPAVQGAVCLRQFAYHPVKLAEAATKVSRFQRVRTAPTIILYWAVASRDDVRVLEVDSVTAVVLAEIDGSRTVRAIRDRIRRRYPGLISASLLRQAVAALDETGLLLAS